MDAGTSLAEVILTCTGCSAWLAVLAGSTAASAFSGSTLIYMTTSVVGGDYVETADVLQEQRAPVVTFSVLAFSQLQCMAACLPQEHLASFAQTHPPSRPQQVAWIWSAV